mgnify:CR=1 FL=1
MTLTILMLLPLVGAIAIATLPRDNADLAKKVALGSRINSKAICRELFLDSAVWN